jgi:hypothetical protein
MSIRTCCRLAVKEFPFRVFVIKDSKIDYKYKLRKIFYVYVIATFDRPAIPRQICSRRSRQSNLCRFYN